jgi:hypothetical protein
MAGIISVTRIAHRELRLINLWKVETASVGIYSLLSSGFGESAMKAIEYTGSKNIKF